LSSLNASELYGAHTPRWSFAPVSGAGAAVQGGRFNRKGIEALYLTLEAKTALAEYQQVSPLLEPCMLTSYIASVGRVVDLVRTAGHAGILFPSVANRGGTNVVLYQDIFASGDSISTRPGRWWESLKRLKVITMLSSALMEKVWWISIHWLIYLTG
jgi:RES domain-containing protein